MKAFPAATLILPPAGSGMTPDVAFVLLAGAMLGYHWLALQVVLIGAQHPGAFKIASKRTMP